MTNAYFRGLEHTIFSLPRPQQGEVAYATDTEKFYAYNNGWYEVKAESDGAISLNLYELNKQINSQLQPITEDQYFEKIELINNYVKDTQNIHYMLYGKDISYFTVFQKHIGYDETVGEAVIDCIKNVGHIRSIDLTWNKDAVEIWVDVSKNDDEKELIVMYLFMYDSAIVPVGG